MVHGVRLADGQGRSGTATAGSSPSGEDFGPNTNVLEHAGRTLALVEAGPSAVRADRRARHRRAAATSAAHSLTAGSAGYTAHPHEDPETGELHAVSYNWMRGNKVDYTVIDTDGTGPPSRSEVEVTGSADDPRLRADRALRGDLRPARHLRHRHGDRRMPRAWPAARPDGQPGDRGQPDARPDRRRGGPRRPSPARRRRCPTPGTPTTRRGSACCPATAAATTCAGSRSTPATSSTPSTPTRTRCTGEVVIDAVRHDRMFATDFTGPNEGLSSLVRFTLDLGCRQGPRAPVRRARPGVPAVRRAADRAAAPLRLHGRVRRAGSGRHGAQARRRRRHHPEPHARRRPRGRRVLLRARPGLRRSRTTAC